MTHVKSNSLLAFKYYFMVWLNESVSASHQGCYGY